MLQTRIRENVEGVFGGLYIAWTGKVFFLTQTPAKSCRILSCKSGNPITIADEDISTLPTSILVIVSLILFRES
jgi:hypothetical protein